MRMLFLVGALLFIRSTVALAGDSCAQEYEEKIRAIAIDQAELVRSIKSDKGKLVELVGRAQGDESVKLEKRYIELKASIEQAEAKLKAIPGLKKEARRELRECKKTCPECERTDRRVKPEQPDPTPPHKGGPAAHPAGT